MSTSPVKLWRRQKNTAGLIGQTGVLRQWTVIRVPAKSFMNQAPYPVVIIELKNGEKMIGQLVDWDVKDLVYGRAVVAVLRKHFVDDKESIIPYCIKFKPA